MKLTIVLAGVIIFLGLVVGPKVSALVPGANAAPDTQERKLPEVIEFSASKLGTVTFNHLNHATKNYNLKGDGPIACVECHHTAQPAAEVAKRPPLQSAWPKDRTTTLTAESLKDPKSPEVVGCRSCHARTGEKPKVWPEIPQVKYEGSATAVILNNQQAFHRKCAGCHDAVVKERPNVKAPKTTQCTICHVKK